MAQFAYLTTNVGSLTSLPCSLFFFSFVLFLTMYAHVCAQNHKLFVYDNGDGGDDDVENDENADRDETMVSHQKALICSAFYVSASLSNVISCSKAKSVVFMGTVATRLHVTEHIMLENVEINMFSWV